jgi:hypothetical protein
MNENTIVEEKSTIWIEIIDGYKSNDKQKIIEEQTEVENK